MSNSDRSKRSAKKEAAKNIATMESMNEVKLI